MEYNLNTKEEQKSVILGMLLGDAGLHSEWNKIYFGQSIKQIEYALFKKKLLEEITGKSVHTAFINQNGYDGIRVFPKVHPIITDVISKLYVGRRKIITRDALNNLTLQGIAIWFMDDGSCSIAKHKGILNGGLKVTLNTYLPFEDNQILIDYFKERWGITWYNNYSKGFYRLGMGTMESRKLFPLIEPYIIPEMKYKLKKSISELNGQPFNYRTKNE